MSCHVEGFESVEISNKWIERMIVHIWLTSVAEWSGVILGGNLLWFLRGLLDVKEC